MLRLAKMYLYGQGCQRSVNLAQEWLRRARYAFEAFLRCRYSGTGWQHGAERSPSNKSRCSMHAHAGMGAPGCTHAAATCNEI